MTLNSHFLDCIVRNPTTKDMMYYLRTHYKASVSSVVEKKDIRGLEAMMFAADARRRGNPLYGDMEMSCLFRYLAECIAAYLVKTLRVSHVLINDENGRLHCVEMGDPSQSDYYLISFLEYVMQLKGFDVAYLFDYYAQAFETEEGEAITQKSFWRPAHLSFFCAAVPSLLELVMQKHPLYDWNTADVNGKTALHHICISRVCVASMEKLLEIKDLDINLRDGRGMTPLMLASFVENYEMVECLLEDPRLTLNTRDHVGRTALIYALMNVYQSKFSEAIVRACLFMSHPQFDFKVNVEDVDEAVIYQSPIIVASLLVKGCNDFDFASLKQLNNNTDTLLMVAEDIISVFKNCPAPIRWAGKSHSPLDVLAEHDTFYDLLWKSHKQLFCQLAMLVGDIGWNRVHLVSKKTLLMRVLQDCYDETDAELKSYICKAIHAVMCATNANAIDWNVCDETGKTHLDYWMRVGLKYVGGTNPDVDPDERQPIADALDSRWFLKAERQFAKAYLDYRKKCMVCILSDEQVCGLLKTSAQRYIHRLLDNIGGIFTPWEIKGYYDFDFFLMCVLMLVQFVDGHSVLSDDKLEFSVDCLNAILISVFSKYGRYHFL